MPAFLVTRPQPDADDTVARLSALGLEGIAVPLLERQVIATSLPDPAGFSALALTSTNALRVLEETGRLAPYLRLKVFAVGERTAAAARAAGFETVVAAGGTLARLVEALEGAGLAGPVFYPAARHPSGDLAKALAPAGVMVVTARVYDMRPATTLPKTVREGLAEGRYAGALLYSRRTAETFVRLASPLVEVMVRPALAMLCLSEQVAAPLIAAHFVRVGLADHPSEQAMMALTLSFARDRNTA
jgi:uroporphyrinogen-III synthase